MMTKDKLLPYGLITGILFGFFLQKAQVLRYETQLSVLRLKDMTLIKFMMSASAVAMTLIYLLKDLGQVTLEPRQTRLANVLGGLTFGAGWSLLGYCPGTSVGALSEGRWDALFGILGMLTGAGIYAETYPQLKETVLSWFDFGKITVPQALNLNHWLVIPGFILFALGLFGLLEKEGL